MLNKFWRLFFRLLYNECAFSYDLISRAVSLGHWRSWQRAALRHLPAAETGLVLELAHGTGDLQLDLLRAGYRTVALDLSPQMGKLAQRKLSRDRMAANLIRGDAFRLPCKSNSFSAIVCTFPTPFIFSASVLAEMERALAPSGRVAIVLAGRLAGGGILPALIRRLYRITGQRDDFLSGRACADLIASDAFHVESEIVALQGSAAQLLLLTKVAAAAKSSADLSLETASDLCYDAR
ncbi:MAG: methyltransferase domain-containing protein [Chloroflexi bacterium]|nr:methyltransferase domain-containing protein [Chloroflexota bacterium]